MLSLNLLRAGLSVTGLEPGTPVVLIGVEDLGGDVWQVSFRRPNGQLTDLLVTRDDEARLSEAAAPERAWSFAADGNLFTLATEAHRMRLAHLFDPLMAVHSSDVEPLPHQITAVYEAMLTRQPLRFVLADDPGAGKTVMAGLLIRELLMRADARRILIVAPGSLTDQWQDEMRQKFGLDFPILSTALASQTAAGNVFDAYDLLIARVDQLARNSDWREQLDAAQPWDLVVVDEAHKLAAHWSGQEVRKTIRFGLGEQLGRRTRHYLLMTATPHNGKEEDFQLFMSLLDAERFYGRFRDGRTEPVDASDLMRRLVKEQLRTFDNRPLFPERKPYTLAYELSPAESALYEAVTHYVVEQMDQAKKLDGRKRSVTGFALTALQRRLASSPGSIYKSLTRRRERLEEVLKQAAKEVGLGGRLDADGWFNVDLSDLPEDEWEDAWNDQEREDNEDEMTSRATTARTVYELQAEVQELRILEEQARKVVQNPAQSDCKWEKLRDTLHNNPLMRDASGLTRKLIIFTEYRDTLLYLRERLTRLLGDDEAVVCIDGTTPRPERLHIQGRFWQDERVRVLLATDAAGEGINLQNAHLMVNYDLPWNPNRLEQRFGRIHRIGQKEVCHLFNLVAAETREGAVYKRLLDKLEQIGKDLPGGRVFDVLGEVFEGTPLRKLLEEAIMYGDKPEVRNRLNQQLDDALNTEHLNDLLRRNALYEEVFGVEHLQSIREAMDQAEARKLQPYYVRYFTERALQHVQAELRPMEPDRFRIPYVPIAVRDRARELGSSDRRQVLDRYERVCFEKAAIRRERLPLAELLHPGHLLVRTLTDILTEVGQGTLSAGATLLDPTDETGTEPRLLFLLEHTIRDQTETDLSKRLQFVWVWPSGEVSFAGWAPHLDLRPFEDETGIAVRQALADHALLSQPDPAQAARRFAIRELAPEHGREVRQRREAYVDKAHAAVLQRLTRELEYWDDAIVRAREERAAGKPAAEANLTNAQQTHRILQDRLRTRLAELERMRAVQTGVPTILGGALVVPTGLLRKLNLVADSELKEAERVAKYPISAEARARVELAAMQAVTDAEIALGHSIADVSAKKCGWDLTTTLPALPDGKLPIQRHLEVKGRAASHDDTVVLTRNELMEALNQADKFVLALVIVHSDGRTEGPHYVPQPFGPQHLPPPEMVQGVFKLSALLARAISPVQYYAEMH